MRGFTFNCNLARVHQALVLTLVGALGFLLSACGVTPASNGSGATVTSCVLPADQGATINGRWLPTSVPIAFQQGAWSSEEVDMIVAAAQTWNTFFAESMGYPAIDVGATPRYSTQPLPTDEQTFCAQNIATNSSFTEFTGTSPIVIYKDGQWPSDYTPAVIALTTSCKQSVSGRRIPVFSNSYMEVNYQYFFVTSDVPDLQSIVLHEFGHLMGLRHSCEVGSTTVGMPDCSSPSLEPSYLSALMYPSFSFNAAGIGQQKRAILSDDEGRMNCIYQDL